MHKLNLKIYFIKGWLKILFKNYFSCGINKHYPALESHVSANTPTVNIIISH